MAKGKKSKGTTYVSKGENGSVDPKIAKAVKKDRRVVDVLINKVDAWKKMKNPWITISNPSKADTRARFIRVRANEIWGDPRGQYRMAGSAGGSDV